jgi:hypothetical protein
MGSKVLRKGGPQEVYVRCFFVSYNGPIDTLPEEERQFAHQYIDIFVSANTFSHARDLNLRAVFKPLLRDAQGVAQPLSSLVPSARQETTADTVSQGAQTEPMFPQRQDTVYAQQSISWGEPRVAPADLCSIFHQRFAHVNKHILTKISRQHCELHIPKKYMHSAVSQGPKVNCSCCMQNKATVGRTFPLGDPRHKADRFLSRVCMDFSGQIQIPGYNGACYFCVFVDEATDFTWIYLAKSRAEAPDILRRFFIDAHSMTDHKVVILRTDNAGKFHSLEFQGILQGYNVKMECCCPYSHYQNGKAERMIRDVSEKARCMMNHAQCPCDFWTWAVRHAVWVRNCVSVEAFKSPYELVYGHKPDLSMLRVFGCSAVVAKDSDAAWVQDSKWDSRGVPGIFVSIATDGHDVASGASVKGYVVWTLETGPCLITSVDVQFDEQVYPRLLCPIEWELSEARGGKTTLKPSALHTDSQGLDVLPFEVTAEEINACAATSAHICHTIQ